MASHHLPNFEGTGVEISEYAKKYPTERFRLTVLDNESPSKQTNPLSVDEMAAKARQANREGRTRKFPA